MSDIWIEPWGKPENAPPGYLNTVFMQVIPDNFKEYYAADSREQWTEWECKLCGYHVKTLKQGRYCGHCGAYIALFASSYGPIRQEEFRP